MTQMIVTFPPPQAITLIEGETLTLQFPPPQGITLQVEGIQGPPGTGSGVTDGDKGGILVSGAGTVWTVKAGSITDLMMGASAIALFAPALHTHTIANVTGLQAALDGKSAIGHTHTAAEVTDLATATRGTVLTGYSVAGARLALAAGDTILGAFGKLGKWLADLAPIAFSGSASDLTTGTLPAARFDDTAHGARSGGATHAAVIPAGASGFMTGADKTKLDGIATGATANATDAALRDRATHTGTQLAATISDLAAAVAATAAVTANTAKVTNATHTGDATGATALTLATVNANVGSFGLAGSVAQFVVNAKGLITSAVNVAISIASTAISDATTAGRAMLTAASAAAQTALLDVFTSGAKGLAPASGGGTANFLRADGTWAAAGGGSPVTVQDEGSTITTALGTLNFVGAGVTVTGGATATVTVPGGGGGGPTGGSATINFGAAPGTNIAQVAITGQTGITAGARVRAWIQGDSTADHNVYTHTRILARKVALSCENITAGVGFAIVASTELRLTGNVSVRWEWSV